MPQTKKRRPPALMDQYRAAALRGDRLADLPDSDREWIWHSLLKGVRLAEAVTIADLRSDQIEPALTRIKRWYDHRLLIYKRQQAAKATPKVVKPIAPTKTPRQRRGWWPFGKGGA